MQAARIFFTLGTVFFLALGIYLKLAERTAQGEYVGKYGDWHQSSFGAGSVFFFALVFLSIRIVLMKRFNKDQ
jgi:hypothetical protein